MGLKEIIKSCGMNDYLDNDGCLFELSKPIGADNGNLEIPVKENGALIGFSLINKSDLITVDKFIPVFEDVESTMSPDFTFVDSGKEWCNIRNTDYGEYGDPAICIGRSNVVPKFMIKEHGWFDYPLPENVSIHSNILLNQKQAEELIHYLQYFVDNGELPKDIIGRN